MNNLTNTTWTFNEWGEVPVTGSQNVTYNISFTSNGNSYSGFVIQKLSSEVGANIYYDGANPVQACYAGVFVEEYQTINIINGQDVTNTDLISLLTNNFNLISLDTVITAALTETTLSWDAVINADYYNVYRDNTAIASNLIVTSYSLARIASGNIRVKGFCNEPAASTDFSNTIVWERASAQNILLHPYVEGLPDEGVALYPKTKYENIIDLAQHISNQVTENSGLLVTSGAVYTAVSEAREIVNISIRKEDTRTYPTFAQIKEIIDDQKLPVLNALSGERFTLCFYYQAGAFFVYEDIFTDKTHTEVIEIDSNGTISRKSINNENQANKVQALDNSETNYPSTKAVKNVTDALSANINTIINDYAISASVEDNTLTIITKVEGQTQTIIFAGSDNSAIWGNITGSIADQTDLQEALDNKVDKQTGYSLMSSDEHTKLAGIESGAEVNVNADWNATSGDAEILNKPTIPTKTSELQNDSNYATESFVNSSIATSTAYFTGTFENVPLLNVSLVKSGSILKAGTILKKGSYVNNYQYPDDTTLNTDLSVTSDSMLMPGIWPETSSIYADSTIAAGSIINHVLYENNSIPEEIIYISRITPNDYAFVQNSEYNFTTVNEMNAYNKRLLTNFDYGWVPHGTKYDLYRFDIVAQRWDQVATSIDKSSDILRAAYNRYKYIINNSIEVGMPYEYIYEYTLNNSSFTQAQWDAITSGITAGDVEAFEAHIQNLTVHVTQQDKEVWGAKQNAITNNNMLSSDLVDDTNKYHKFVTGAMYDYLEGILYQAPTISIFQLYYNGSAVATTLENGSSVTVNQIRHQETNIANISSLTFNGQAITPSATATIVNLTTPITVSATTTYTMSGVNTRNASFTKGATITVNTYAYSSLTSSTTAPTTGLTRQSVDSTFRSSGASFNYVTGDYLYLYTVYSGATKIQTNVLGQWADVNTTVVGQVTITKSNGVTQTYYCFRTTSAFSASGSATYRVV